MNNLIKLLLFNILLCAAPAIQAMGSVRTFGARAIKAASATAAKLNPHAFNAYMPSHMVFPAKQYTHKAAIGYKFATAGTAILMAGILWNSYDVAPQITKHDYDAVIPENIKALLDSHEKDFEQILPRTYTSLDKPYVQKFDWLPGSFVKKGHRRIEGAKQFSAAIDELNYSNFIVPEKYRYTSPCGNHYTISKVIEPSGTKLTKEEFKQLYRLAKKLTWLDPHSGNFMKTKENTIALIDTKTDRINLDYESFNNEDHLRWSIILRFWRDAYSSLDDEAQRYLKIKHCQYNPWNEHFWENSKKRELRRSYKEFFTRFNNHLRTCSAIEN